MNDVRTYCIICAVEHINETTGVECVDYVGSKLLSRFAETKHVLKHTTVVHFIQNLKERENNNRPQRNTEPT